MFDNNLITSNYTLLYAEDEPEVRGAYSFFFKNYFKEVIVVENGEDAWQEYLDKKPNIVVLDILMPGLNGVEVAKRIREKDKETIIMIMTANDTKEWLYSSVELGLTKFIKKGTIKFTEFEKLLMDIIKDLDEAKTKDIQNNNLWYISPKGSKNEIVYDLINHKLYMNGELIDLSKKLIQVINYFGRHKDRIISHEELSKALWESENSENKKTSTDQKIRAFLYTIKQKLGGANIFKSHYNQGYTVEYSGE